MATTAPRSQFYYPLLGLAAALLVTSLLIAIVGGATRPALYVFVVASIVIVLANAREWRHQHRQQST
ncbi:hypothetical protein [Pseudokineococcus marinus]|uniref:Uncharacterized protein n=1 Tax=Pseudokineococcus marinus TaxID=351215 RepID=A0A849BPB6_9ACTN|nr:hypothetical protein [Pseudokineococcus marinus]NNH22877.1 hypothetical protein [Pseudokineococcus marinus]